MEGGITAADRQFRLSSNNPSNWSLRLGSGLRMNSRAASYAPNRHIMGLLN